MTNAEVFERVFKIKVDRSTCPIDNCDNCPANNGGPACTYSFWNDEYKGDILTQVEVIEHHTFAKPDDVSQIDFPSVSSEDK